jgi:D-beta-D-heptose 7-phosphate kinase/D-beta-D-heptose 1-phosphate adenosyltransferase
MVIEARRESAVPGGAANVVNNLLAFGAEVAVVGVVGDDDAGRMLKRLLEEEGADTSGIVAEPGRPTTRKTRVVAHSQQVLRVDREWTAPPMLETRDALLRHGKSLMRVAEGAVLSDYDKGMLRDSLSKALIERAGQSGTLVTANPKPANARCFRGADVASLNLSEARAASGNPEFGNWDMARQGETLRSDLKVRSLVVTRGAEGLSLWLEDGQHVRVPAHPVEVYDVAGAGDTTISAMTLGLLAGASPEEAAIVANHAAACVVRKVGVATATPEELLADWSDD